MQKNRSYRCWRHFLSINSISHKDTLFENCSKCRIWIFEFWHFPLIFVLIKLTCLVKLFDRKHLVFKNSPKWTIFGIFNQLLSTQNVNVSRFALIVEWDFFCDFTFGHFMTPPARARFARSLYWKENDALLESFTITSQL